VNRRNALLGLSLLLGGCGSGGRNRPLPNTDLLVNTQQRHQPLTPDFIGLSWESSALADRGLLSADNTQLVALLRALSPSGVLRLGGESCDQGLWQRGSAQLLMPPYKFAITHADIDRLRDFLDASGWRLIYGINFGRGDPRRAADEAAYVTSRLGDRLLALQLGNEPDLYAVNDVRTRGYGFGSYLDEWKGYADAIRQAAPNAPLAGPDAAYETDWIEGFARDEGERLRLLSGHYYAVGPADDPTVDIGALYSSRYQHYPQLRNAAKKLASSGKPLRITEAGACFGGGKPGVSDTLAAALWALTWLSDLARDGVAGACFQCGAAGSREPGTPIAATAAGNLEARPLYYGLLLFAQLLPGTRLESHLKSPNRALSAFCVADADQRIKVLLINQDEGRATDVRIVADRPLISGSLLRLTAPTLFSRDGVRLGGAAAAADGGWNADLAERAAIEGGAAFVTVPPSGAMLVTLSS